MAVILRCRYRRHDRSAAVLRLTKLSGRKKLRLRRAWDWLNEAIWSAFYVSSLRVNCTYNAQDARKAEMLTSRFFEEWRRLFLFPKTPHGNVAKIERVPPRVHHLPIESE